MRDNLFNNNIDIADFRFDADVVKVFDDMVRRSVPGYDSMIQMVGLVARMYGQDNTNYYDLGSSTGAISFALALNNKNKNNTFIAIDNSVEMVKKCQANLSNKIDNLQVLCSDITDTEINDASIVVFAFYFRVIDRHFYENRIVIYRDVLNFYAFFAVHNRHFASCFVFPIDQKVERQVVFVCNTQSTTPKAFE